MRSVLAVSAHPDDESLFAGGTLAMYAGRRPGVRGVKSASRR
jgi:LmbE family N-acetylglucosaminyl deacetylase